MTITLPYPPSANRYCRVWRGRILVSAAARSYKQMAAGIALAAGVRPLAGAVAIRWDRSLNQSHFQSFGEGRSFLRFLQGASGLGLEGQQAAIDAYAKAQAANVIYVYREVESGRKTDRPELAKALAHAKRSGATLVVAKLDRLARNVAFLSRIMEAKVDFIAVDNPAANNLTLHILAAVAEAEAEAISARTKAALAAYKARGGKLGGALPQCNNLSQESRERGAKASGAARRAKANEVYADLLPIIQGLRQHGHTQTEIAQELNRMGHTTRSGQPFSQVQVLRLLRRAAG